jgi:hypothetical protein
MQRRGGTFSIRKLLRGRAAKRKSQIPSTKHQTNSKSQFDNVQNVNARKDLFCVSVIWILVIRICFGFRYSDLGFEAGGISQQQ